MSFMNTFFNSPDMQIQMESAGKSMAAGFLNGLRENMPSSQDLQGPFGFELGNKIKETVQDIFREAFSDFHAESISKSLSDFWIEFFEGIEGGEIGKTASEKISDLFNELMRGLDLRRGSEEFKENMQTFGENMGHAVFRGGAPIVDNFSGLVQSGYSQILPWVVGGLVLTTAAPLLTYYAYKRAVFQLGRPKLAIEERNVKWYMAPYDWTKSSIMAIAQKIGISSPSTIDTPVFDAQIERKVAEISQSIAYVRKNKGYFQNVLLYGPAGTGKTMVSRKIAKDAGLNYVMMSGGDLAQYIKRGEHVTELNHLFEKIKNSSVPTILFIDEVESLGKKRSQLSNQELLELQNAFLNQTGTQSKKLMIIAATNRPEDLDDAVLSRFDRKMEIAPPAYEQRIAMIRNYLPHFFSKNEIEQNFHDEYIQAVAKRIEGFSGRSLFKMLNSISLKKYGTKENRLNSEMIEETVADYIQEEKKILETSKTDRSSSKTNSGSRKLETSLFFRPFPDFS
jgi:chromosomal replication initiation ATPase DnaA